MKKLLGVLTFLWAIATTFLFIGSENLIFATEKFNKLITWHRPRMIAAVTLFSILWFLIIWLKKKVPIMLTNILAVIAVVSFFVSQENFIWVAKKIGKFPELMSPSSPFQVWFELGIVCGTMLITALWTIVILRKKTK